MAAWEGAGGGRVLAVQLLVEAVCAAECWLLCRLRVQRCLCLVMGLGLSVSVRGKRMQDQGMKVLAAWCCMLAFVWCVLIWLSAILVQLPLKHLPHKCRAWRLPARKKEAQEMRQAYEREEGEAARAAGTASADGLQGASGEVREGTSSSVGAAEQPLQSNITINLAGFVSFKYMRGSRQAGRGGQGGAGRVLSQHC